MRLRWHALGVMVAVQVLVAVGCGDDDDDDSTTGATLEVSCTDVDDPACDPPQTQTDSIAATNLNLCNYWESTQSLQVGFLQAGSGTGVLVEIAGFTGAGSYTTNADGTTNVTVTTEFGNIDAAGVAGSIEPHECTITATSNLATITIPDEGDANILDVDLNVSCPDGLGGGAVCAWECSVSPVTIPLSVKGCVASQ